MSNLGCYFFARGGVHNTLKTALELGYSAIKFHARHPFKTHEQKIPADHLHAYRAIRSEHRDFPVFIQANKLINIASPLAEDTQFAVRELERDYRMGSLLEPTGIVVQAGNHRHFGERQAIYRMTETLEHITMKLIGHLGICTIILETSSGEGTAMGYKFEHFKSVIDGLSAPHVVEICLDISNIFAAGYDISSEDGLEHTLDEFHYSLDLDRIACINLSDADYPLGSRKRFRAPLGQGEIGIEALKRIVNHPELAAKPFILENLVSKNHADLHPDYETAQELFEQFLDPNKIHEHRRLLSDQRMDFIFMEHRERLRQKYGVEENYYYDSNHEVWWV